MTTKAEAGISLADLDTTKADAFEFEFLLPDGTGTGVFLTVLGSTHPDIDAEINRGIDEIRRKEQLAEAQARVGNRKAELEPVADIAARNHRACAKRLVGWRGIKDAYSPEAALQLVKTNPAVYSQVLEASNNLGNFLRGVGAGSA